jgi:phosphoenolpyruvate carboxykinase (ATP)
MTTSSTQPAAPYAADLQRLLGLNAVSYKYNLSKEELFHEAIANDRGRVAKDGPSNAQKAYPTQLGVKGPLVYYTDPDCTGRRVKDTYAVGWPEVNDVIWWKDDLNKYDPAKYEGLLKPSNKTDTGLNSNHTWASGMAVITALYYKRSVL